MGFIKFLFYAGVMLGSSSSFALETVQRVELNKYLGLWYEILRLPNEFQDEIRNDGSGFSSCFNTTAEYVQRDDGRIAVKNTCFRQRGHEVKTEVADGKARVVAKSNAKLKVNFTGNPILERLGIGDGDYWILDLGDVNKEGQYSYALVGEPSLEHMWVLSRNSTMDQPQVRELLKKAEAMGFDVDKVVYSR